MSASVAGLPNPHAVRIDPTRRRSLLRWLAAAAVLLASSLALADIPGQDRSDLIAFYLSDNGDQWIDHSNWLGAAGTECTWFGITCDATGSEVIDIILPANNIVGSRLPDIINGYRSLVALELYQNQLSGALPSLENATSLQYFLMDDNQFTGAVPTFAASIVSVGLTDNQLTGPIPDLAGYPALVGLGLEGNQLSGTIPSIAGNPLLEYFYVGRNMLSGEIPPLTGSPGLVTVLLDHAGLSGPLPDLTGLTQLYQISFHDNLLTGTVPDLSTLQSLAVFSIGGNLLTGTLPPPPSSNQMLPGYSILCPNPFDADAYVDNAEWDVATGMTPWYADCDPVFADGFDGPA